VAEQEWPDWLDWLPRWSNEDELARYRAEWTRDAETGDWVYRSTVGSVEMEMRFPYWGER
jgi:hypothetical protein